MDDMFFKKISESRTSYSNDFSTLGAVSPLYSCLSIEKQSPSVTLNGQLWQQSLVQMIHTGSAISVRKSIGENVEQGKREALIKLLRSWREGDEEEQKSAW